MAKKNEILLSIALEGDAEVKGKLQSVGESGKKSLSGLEKNIGGAGSGLERLAKPLDGVREALDPLLEAAGLRLGGVIGGGGLVARLFGAAGPAAALAALSGLAIHLAKVAEASSKADERLKAVGAGDRPLDRLNEQAKGLGTSSETIRPGLESLFADRQKLIAREELSGGISHAPGFEPGDVQEKAAGVNVIGRNGTTAVPSRETYEKAYNSLFSEGRRDSSNSEEIARAVSQYLSSIGRKGSVSAPDLDALHGVLPHAADFAAQSLSKSQGRNFANAAEFSAYQAKTGAVVPFQQQLTDLAAQEPRAKADAEAARGVNEALEHLAGSAGRLDEAFGKLAGAPLNKLLTEGLDKVSAGVDKAATLLEHSAPAIRQGAKTGFDLGNKTPIPGAGILGGAIGAGFAAEFGIGKDLVKEFGPGLTDAIRKPFETGIPAFLKNALINPAAIPGNQPAPIGKGGLTAEGLAATKIPSPLDSVSPKALLLGNPPPGAGAGAPELLAPQPPVQPAAKPLAPLRTSDGLLIAPGEPPTPPSQRPPDDTPLSRPLLGPHDRDPDLKGFDYIPWSPEQQHQLDRSRGEDFQYIPPPPREDQQRLDRDRSRGDDQSIAPQGDLPPPWRRPLPPAEPTQSAPPSLNRADLGAPFQTAELQPPQPALPAFQQSAPPAQPPAAIEGIAAAITGLINQARDRVLGPPDNVVKGPVDAIGVRGEGAPEGAQQNVAALGSAASDLSRAASDLSTAAGNLGTGDKGDKAASVPVQAAAGGGMIRRLDGGGGVSGPGTATSDSIPAMLSDGEYVIKASSARKLGRQHLDYLNAGGFADGGQVARRLAKVRGFAGGGAVRGGPPAPVATGAGLEYQVSFDETTGGLNVGGILYPPGSALFDDPMWRQIWENARRDHGQNKGDDSGHRKHHSDFVGRFGHDDSNGALDTYVATGGLITPHGVMRGNAAHFADGGAVGHLAALSGLQIDVPHLADGGGALDVAGLASTIAGGTAPSVTELGGGSSNAAAGHHSVDLRTNHGDFRMMASEDVARQMTAAARDSANVKTGERPSWFGGGR
jgi:hypothetical protein